jgi:hypothetical protein
LLAPVAPIRADFETGKQAYKQGDYAAALKEFAPLMAFS